MRALALPLSPAVVRAVKAYGVALDRHVVAESKWAEVKHLPVRVKGVGLALRCRDRANVALGKRLDELDLALLA